MSSAKPTAAAANPKRASGDTALNPKRASGGAPLTSSTAKPAASSAAAKPASSSAAAKPAAAASGAAAPSAAAAKKPAAAAGADASKDVTKGVAGLKVADSPPGEKRRLGVAAGRRRGGDDEPAPAAASASASSAAAAAPAASSASATLSAAKANQARRRLSLTAGNQDASKVDGHAAEGEGKDPLTKVLKSMAASNAAPAAAKDSSAAAPAGAGAAAASSSAAASSKPKRRPFSHYSSLSKVGYIPFNPNKVNQDRSVEIVKFGNQEDKAFFGVFDGHGALGHEVSSFLIQELPKFFLKQPNLDSHPHEAITKAFIDCNVKLASSSIDCTFSGSTGIVVYIAHGKIYSCNAGDSRAVLARATANGGTGEHKLTAIKLSEDQKPEREDEKKRILENKGRVEACKGLKGEDIGPPRVWLSHQDVPGLAMSRSFGDLIAASVGVIAKPEIWERDMADGDKFMILASDGVWEFISNQEAVDLVHSVGTRSGPEEAVSALVNEATKRWHAEEEVVDDITAVVVYF